MADESITTNAHADEIAALKKQMEEMQKRLEELSAAPAEPVQEESGSEEVAEDAGEQAQPEESPAQSGEASLPVLSMQEEQTNVEDGEGSVSEWGLTFTVRDATPTGATLVWEQSGGSPTGELETGSDFFLERLEDGEWEAVPYIDPNVAWTAEGYLVPMGETVEKAVNWEWIYGELSAGEYRVCKDFMDFRETADYDTKTLRAPFVLE